MAEQHKHSPLGGERASERIPPGATRRAFDREDNGGGPPGSPLGDRHGAGSSAGGSEVGGMAGSNVAGGDPLEEGREIREPDGPYAGHAGGAVGGTPAEGRSSGGRTKHGLDPGGSHRGDSTIGSKS